MIDQRLFIYIEQELKRGVPNLAIKNALCDAGWPEEAVNQAFVAVQSRNAPPRPEPEFPEGEIGQVTAKPKKIKKRGRRLSPIAIVAIVGVVVAILAGIWYFIFIVPEQDSEMSDTTPNILKKNDAGNANASGTEAVVWPNGMDPGTAGTGNGEGSLVVTPGGEGQVPGVQDTLTGMSAQNPGAGAPGLSDQGSVFTGADAKRKEDLDKMAAAQKLWFNEKGKYYTCGLTVGDCGGKPYGFPEQIGIYLSNAGQDPLVANYAGKKAVCGTDYMTLCLENFLGRVLDRIDRGEPQPLRSAWTPH